MYTDQRELYVMVVGSTADIPGPYIHFQVNKIHDGFIDILAKEYHIMKVILIII